MSISPSRGVKRTADDAFGAPRRIRALHQDVVNKIAAGEIIVAPFNALKELMENAVDAGATAIQITAKDGGLKTMQISDNGSGINKDDLPILCERFTTSKLKVFEDLESMSTYGFRGEALASISHIAHMTVTTKSRGSAVAYKVHYAGGKMVGPRGEPDGHPLATAGSQGTTILVEDLFYNTPSRRAAKWSPSEEYAKILDQVGRYAIHCKGVAFSCKKIGDASTSLTVPAQADVINRIRLVYNSTIANELFAFEKTDEKLAFRAEGWASSANYSGKKTTYLLFINHRSVESIAVKKAVEQTYQQFLPRHGHPFVYLSLEIEPTNVDVNVHPTKKHVNFLNEDEIIEMVCDEIRAGLAKVDTSRTFTTQTLLSSKRPTQTAPTDEDMPDAPPSDTASSRRTPQSRQMKPYENNLVRTDSRAQKITSMLPPARPTSPTKEDVQMKDDSPVYTTTDREPTLCRLTSIKQLRAEVRDRIHNELTTSISQHTFVGIVDSVKRIAAIQAGVKLLLIDYGMMSAEYFYQLGLTDFGNFGVIKLEPPLDLKALLEIAAKKEAAAMSEREKSDHPDFDWDAAVERVWDRLIERRDMLAEYFSLHISEVGKVEGLPLMVKGYTPSMVKLSGFLLRLGPRVDWEDEKGCFESFLRELALWYVPEPVDNADIKSGSDGSKGSGRRKHLERVIEHVLFPAFKQRLVTTKDLKRGVLEVADLKGLYRVFERC